MSSKLRIGIIGAGGIVRDRHMPALQKMSDVEIVAVSNRTPESAQRFVEDFGLKAEIFHRWEKLVDAPQVDVVWIGATPYLHHESSVRALRAGKHVFCQARMASSLPEAEQMWEAAVGFPEQVAALCPPPQGMVGGMLVKELLKEKRIGELIHADLRSQSSAWLNRDSPMHWRQDRGQSGIQILTLGIYVEVLQDWLGPIREVFARGRVVHASRSDGIVEIPDFVNVSAEFDSGVVAELQFSGLAAHAPGDELWIHGTEGSLRYDFLSDSIEIGSSAGDLEAIEIPPHLRREWTVERDFVNSVRDLDQPRPRPNFTDGVCYMRVVDAVARSLASGEPKTCHRG